eukprot:9502517-Pyramimonas_sp.AAC.1
MQKRLHRTQPRRRRREEERGGREGRKRKRLPCFSELSGTDQFFDWALWYSLLLLQMSPQQLLNHT